MEAQGVEDRQPGTAEGLLAVLPGRAAVVAADGAILAANAGWTRPSPDAPAAPAPETAVQALADCAAAPGQDTTSAREAAAGLAAVLAGEREAFSLDYRGGPAGEQRWYRMHAAALAWHGQRAALVKHVDIDRGSERGARTAERQPSPAEDVHRLNHALERRVARRTRQLEVANRELEAFSYSVSHDLKAPLAAIDGFTQVLYERLHDRLEERELGYLRRVRTGVASMFGLIDALLALSQLSRPARLDHRRVDLSALAASVIDELREQEPQRECVIRIEPGIEAECDAALMTIVLRNLLGNAWKFSARKPVTHISFGLDADGADGMLTVVVRDCGAGFDPAYASRLFKPFHRLHHSAEFPGTGVGLATVQRILHRHGGSIRLTAEPEEGATVWFTLPLTAWVISETPQ